MAYPSVKELQRNLPTSDPEDMWGAVSGFADQLRAAAQLPLPPEEQLDMEPVKNIVFCGMGGSAIGGDLLRAYLRQDLSVPMVVNREYTLPAFVNEHTLVVVSSFSGNTEETLSALQLATSAGAQVLGISSGGELTKRLSRQNRPLIPIPGGMQPRAALGYSFIPMARMFHRLKLTVRPVDAEIDETITLVGDLTNKYQQDDNTNTAYQLAQALIGLVPVIYTVPELAVVGVRWKGQMAENAQMLAFTNHLPEMNHNEIMGWDRQPNFLKQVALLWLTDAETHPRIQRRLEITGELLGAYPGYHAQFATEGNSRMARIFSLIHLGDWTSLYAALLQEVDPTAIDRISMLKNRLND